LVLVLALAWIAAGWLVQRDFVPVPTSRQAPKTVSRSEDDTLRVLLRLAPFGKAHRAPGMKKVPKVVAPSRLAIILRGTVVTGTGSIALIEPHPGAKLRLFHVGDTVLPGAVLQRVEPRRVLIERNGRLEAVPLAGTRARSRPPAAADIRKNGDRIRISRDLLDHELADFSGLLTQARVLPSMLGGEPAGFRITEIAPGSLYARAGLKNGDVIESVNGIRIQSPEEAMAAYQRLKNAPHIEVRILRRGRPQTLHYDIQ